MFKFEDIKALQVEITTRCQASCPMCMRNVYGGMKNPHLIIDNWTLDEFKRIVNEEVLEKLIYILLCGQYGDPLINPHLQEICKYIVSVNPNIFLVIHTNGSLRNEEWWKELARTMPKKHSLVFGIDGIDNETHSKYRIGTNYDKIISNMKAFISEGGIVTWDFIRFKHNEHQVDAARQLSIELGCQSFAVKDTSRFIDNKPYPVKDENGEILYYLEPSTNTQSGFITQDVVDNYKTILENTKVDCYSLAFKRVYLDASKRLFPCAPHGTTINPTPLYNDIVDPLRVEAVKETNEIFSNIDNDASKRSIKEIIDSPEWQETWTQYANNEKKCITCTKNCGVFEFNLTKFCDEDVERSPLQFD